MDKDEFPFECDTLSPGVVSACTPAVLARAPLKKDENTEKVFKDGGLTRIGTQSISMLVSRNHG